jgi:hypothetical protein
MQQQILAVDHGIEAPRIEFAFPISAGCFTGQEIATD